MSCSQDERVRESVFTPSDACMTAVTVVMYVNSTGGVVSFGSTPPCEARTPSHNGGSCG